MVYGRYGQLSGSQVVSVTFARHRSRRTTDLVVNNDNQGCELHPNFCVSKSSDGDDGDCRIPESECPKLKGTKGPQPNSLISYQQRKLMKYLFVQEVKTSIIARQTGIDQRAIRRYRLK